MCVHKANPPAVADSHHFLQAGIARGAAIRGCASAPTLKTHGLISSLLFVPSIRAGKGVLSAMKLGKIKISKDDHKKTGKQQSDNVLHSVDNNYYYYYI